MCSRGKLLAVLRGERGELHFGVEKGLYQPQRSIICFWNLQSAR